MEELQGYTIETLTPECLNEPLLTPPLDLKCVTGAGVRTYLYVQHGVLYAAPGITHIFDKTATVASREGILSWRENVGKAVAERLLQERCNFGTFMHGQTGEYDRTRQYNFDLARDAVLNFQITHPLPFSVNLDAWEQELKEDVAAWIHWNNLVEAQPLATELPLLSRANRFASRLDWFGWINIGSEGYYKSGAKAGQPKGDVRRVLAIVDKKSSRKSHDSQDYPLQLIAYYLLLSENFPTFQQGQPIYLFNWNPCGFEFVPKFSFTPRFLMPKSDTINEKAWIAGMNALLRRIEDFYMSPRLDRQIVTISGTYQEGAKLAPHILKTTILTRLAAHYGAVLDAEVFSSITDTDQEDD